MTTKLTLSIDEDIVGKIKSFSRRKGISVSRLAEQYFKELTARDIDKAKRKKAVASLRGVLKGKYPADWDWKKDRKEYLEEKYGV